MVKHLFLLRGPDRMAYDAFSSRVLDELAPRLLESGPARVKVTLTTTAPPRISVVPFRRQKLALFSVWDGPGDLASTFGTHDGILGGYRVRESTPVAYERDWPDRATTPGAGLLTLFCKNPKLGRSEFFDEWFERHTPMSLRIHPLWSYVRNVVEAKTLHWSPHYDGIVEEHFREAIDLLSPVRLFGGPLRMVPNMVQVGLHVKRFIDMATIETYLVDELILQG